MNELQLFSRPNGRDRSSLQIPSAFRHPADWRYVIKHVLIGQAIAPANPPQNLTRREL